MMINYKLKPAYFPFTYIPEPVAGILYDFFGGVIVYQPNDRSVPALVRQMADAGKIEIRVPVTGDEEHLASKIAEYRQWGEIHEKRSRTLAALPESNYPSDFPARIRSEILGRTAEPADKTDPLFSSRLFLQMAQQFDQDQDDIDREMAHAEWSRRNLLSSLEGEPADAHLTDLSFPETDPGELMTSSRLSAWCRLMNNDAAPPPVLVTTSQAVIHHLLEMAPVNIHSLKISSSGRAEDPPDALAKALSALARTPWSGGDIDLPGPPLNFPEHIRIQALLVENMGPDSFCSMIIHPEQTPPSLQRSSANTVIVAFNLR